MNELSECWVWENVSAGYQKKVQPLFEHFVDQIFENMNLSKDMTFLDLACGPGTVTFKVCKHVKRVDSIDFSSKMIEAIKTEVREQNYKNIFPGVMDGQDLSSFHDNSRDRIVSFFGFIFFPEPEKSIAEMKRVLSKNGKVFISFWPPARDSPFMSKMNEIIEHSIPEAPQKEAKNTGSLEDELMNCPEKLVQLFEKFGFKKLKLTKLSQDLEIKDFKKAWQDSFDSFAPFEVMKKNMPSSDWDIFVKKSFRYIQENINSPLETKINCYVLEFEHA